MSAQQFSYSLPRLEFTQVKGGSPPISFTLDGTITDLKSYLVVKIHPNLLSGSTITTASVTIDKWAKTTPNSHTFDLSSYDWESSSVRFTIGTTTTGSDIVAPIFSIYGSIPYNVLFEITVQDSNNVATTYSAVYKFNYYINPPTLTDFTFNTNIARGDQILVSGLYIDPSYNVLYPSDIPSKVKFKFNQLELINGDINNEFNEQYAPLVNYDPSGNYTLESNQLQNDNFYQITAIAYWSTGYSAVQNSGSDLFVIARPSINNIQAYDAQNDGGNDGVRADASEQIIATIVLNPLLYVNYLPDEIRFLFYDMNNNLIGTSNQSASLYDPSYNQVSDNLVLTYNITLNSVNLVNPSIPLLNGMPGYSVYAEVNVPVTIDGTSYPDQVRTSDAKTAVFRQGIAPILSLNVGNTWDMVTNSNPSSNPTLYGSSPLLGISGYFLKSGQFASGYDRNLDKTTTKFLLQYSVGQGTLANVVRAALIQQGSQETTEEAMIRAMGSVVSVSNGQYTNVVDPAGVVGPNQKPLVFYIPNVQDTFEETDNVNIFVTIIDTTSQWVDPSGNVINESSSVSDDLIMVNKIPTYSYTSAQKGQTVEPFIDDVYSNSNVMKAISNNQLIQVNKAQVIADSANIITQTANGWNVVNPDAVMSGNPLKLRYPKVNLYYYRNPNYLARPSSVTPWTPEYKQQNASNSFTMSQINQSSSLGMWYVIYQNPGAKQYPFLIAYTCPTDPADTPSSVNKAFWYKSNIFYGPATSSANPNPDPTQSGFTLLYTGFDDGTLYTEIPASRRVQLVVNNGASNKNADVSNELVSMVSVQTSSDFATTNTGDFNFIIRNTGIVTNSLLVGNYQFNFNDSSLMMIDNKLWLVNDDDTIISDSANIITKSNKGWTVVNPDAVMSGNPLKLRYPKVNLYYYRNPNYLARPSSVTPWTPEYKQQNASNSFTMSQINQSSSLGMWYVIYQNPGAKQYPFLIAYTCPTDPADTPSSVNKAFWYKSNIFYGPATSSANPNPDPTQSGFTLLYTGFDDGTLYTEIPASRRVQLVVNNGASNKNADVSNELVSMVSVQTSSDFATTNTGDFNFSLVYAGVVTSGTSFSNINTFFANPLLKLNIPLNNGNSMYFNDATIVSINTPTVDVVVKNVASAPCDQNVAEQPLSPAVAGWCLGMPMLPLLTKNEYTVQYSIQNPNNSNAVVKGLVSNTSIISTLNEPQLTDFTVANFSFNTFNNEQKSSIVFDLTLNPYILDRIDGVHVYFTSDSNSNISQTQIGTFRTSQTGLEIFLLSDASSNLLGSGSNPHSYTDPLVSSQLLWNPYTSATITFVPFRDNRVDSDVAENENLFGTFTASPIWNIPVIDQPSVSGTISLAGGVVNSSSDTVLTWVNDNGTNAQVKYSYPVSFSYVLTMVKDSNPATTVNYTVASPANVSASALLPIATNTTNTYTLTLKKVFEGQYSLADTIVFNSVKVDTSVMVVSVLNPSNTSIVTASWVAPTITGTSSSFANNVASLYLTNSGTAMRSNVTSTTIEVIDASYNVLSQTMGYTYQFQMSLTAQVPYTVNSGSSAESSAVPLALGPATAYTVSTIPNVSLAPYTALGTDSATVLIQNTNTPSLLLNLNANGLEVEGFISLVVVLTQDGTPSKPEGCEVLLQFPSVLNPTYLNDPSSNNLNQFLFPNIVGSAGNVNGNANLVGGESSTAVPLNLVPTGLSNNAGSYTLTIGSVILPSPQGPQPANVGRYGYSSLTFPANSGFVNGEASNIMAILTTRRGTDVMVGTFTFAAPPVASGVSVTSNAPGQYVLNFTLG